MANDKREDTQDPTKDLNDVEVTEVDDKDLEDASGGLQPSTGGDFNCGC